MRMDVSICMCAWACAHGYMHVDACMCGFEVIEVEHGLGWLRNVAFDEAVLGGGGI